MQNILTLCVRAFLREWLQRCEGGEPTRKVLDLLERALATLLHREVLQAARSLRVNPRRALPLTELEKSAKPQIKRFLVERLPRWEKSLRTKLTPWER